MTTDEKFTNDILEILIRSGGSDSISSLRSRMYDNGWKGLGHLSHFTDLVKESGFTVTENIDSRGNFRSTFISV